MREITIKRAAKINTGNYENTDVAIELHASLESGESWEDAFRSLTAMADKLLKEKIDDIELGARAVKSKAGRFGV